MKEQAIKQTMPPQNRQPGLGLVRVPSPQPRADGYAGPGTLEGKVALITGGETGLGRAVAVAFAKEGAHVAFVYLEERGEAMKTSDAVEAAGRQCLKIAANLGDESVCLDVVQEVLERFGRLDILVNNAPEKQPIESLEALTETQVLQTFQSNVFSMLYVTKAALPYLEKGARVINTASVTTYRGGSHLLDSATKGAIVAFTRSLSLTLVDRSIYVNAVALEPVWMPLTTSPLESEKVAQSKGGTCRQQRGVPDEIVRCYLLLACADPTYVSGQILHPDGAEIVDG